MSEINRDPGRAPHAAVDLDAAIDIVARGMIAVESSADVRVRVRERIEAGEERSPILAPRLAWAGAAAVLILAVAAGVWLSRWQSPPETQSPTTPVQMVQHPKPPAASISAVGGVVRPAASQTMAAVRPGVVAQPAKRNVEWTGAEPPIGAPDPLVIESIVDAGVDIGDIGVSPLPALDPIEITDLNQGSTDDARPTDKEREF